MHKLAKIQCRGNTWALLATKELSQATHTARSNLALCLALFLSSSILLTATIFYLDQAETRKKLYLKLFLLQNLINSNVYPQP